MDMNLLHHPAGIKLLAALRLRRERRRRTNAESQLCGERATYRQPVRAEGRPRGAAGVCCSRLVGSERIDFPAYKRRRTAARSIRFLILETCQVAPRAVRTPRRLNAPAILR